MAALLFAYGERSFARHGNSALPPELRSAPMLEEAVQKLPEERAATSSAVKIPIFIYHSVRNYGPHDTEVQREYEIPPAVFEQELKYLQDNGYTALTLDQAAAMIKSGTASPVGKPVVLTFDDGWHSQYSNAFPLLEKYRMTATFYVYTNAIGKKYFMTWDELREMSAAGMTIGDHTMSHPYLPTLPHEELRVEMTESKAIIERELGKPVLHFAAPFGYIDADVSAIAKSAGYVTARSAYKGSMQDNLLRLRGYLVDGSFDDFVAELTR